MSGQSKEEVVVCSMSDEDKTLIIAMLKSVLLDVREVKGKVSELAISQARLEERTGSASKLRGAITSAIPAAVVLAIVLLRGVLFS